MAVPYLRLSGLPQWTLENKGELSVKPAHAWKAGSTRAKREQHFSPESIIDGLKVELSLALVTQ